MISLGELAGLAMRFGRVLWLCAFVLPIHAADVALQQRTLQRFAEAPPANFSAEVRTWLGRAQTPTIERLIEARGGLLGEKPGMEALPGQNNTLIAPSRHEGELRQLLANYQAQWEGTLNTKPHISNRATLQLRLAPRDGWRYTRVLWLDPESGLALRAETYRKSELIEVMQVDNLMVLGESAPISAQANLTQARFVVHNPPDGFRLLQVRSGSSGVQHLYGDGLARVSIFIQSPGQIPSYGGFQQGATSFVARRIGPVDVLGVGEVPIATIERMLSGIDMISP
jgi:hypothetical protein